MHIIFQSSHTKTNWICVFNCQTVKIKKNKTHVSNPNMYWIFNQEKNHLNFCGCQCHQTVSAYRRPTKIKNILQSLRRYATTAWIYNVYISDPRVGVAIFSTTISHSFSQRASGLLTPFICNDPRRQHWEKNYKVVLKPFYFPPIHFWISFIVYFMSSKITMGRLFQCEDWHDSIDFDDSESKGPESGAGTALYSDHLVFVRPDGGKGAEFQNVLFCCCCLCYARKWMYLFQLLPRIRGFVYWSSKPWTVIVRAQRRRYSGYW